MKITKSSVVESRYKSYRGAILAVVIFSAINMLLMFGDFYFLFSSYFTNVLSALAIYGGLPELFIVAIAVIVLYLLCFLFSKKNGGWMIAALVLFSIDTAYIVIDTIFSGEYSFLLDIIFHVVILVYLILAVKAWFDLKKVRAQEEEAEKEAERIKEENAMLGIETEEVPTATRKLTLKRKKAFVGMAATIIVYANGEEVARLKNGATVETTVPAYNTQLGFANNLNSLSTGVYNVPDGEEDLTLSVFFTFTGIGAQEIK